MPRRKIYPHKAFWADNRFLSDYNRLPDDLIVNLEHYPQMGRSFRLRQPETLQASAVLQWLQTRLKAYGVLYAITSPPGPGVPVI